MAKYLIQDTTLTAIGDAIRSKNGYSDRIDPVDMPEEIGKIKGEGVELPELTNPAGAAQIRAGYEAIDANGAKIEGEMPTVEMYVDEINIDDASGTITARAKTDSDRSGYVQTSASPWKTKYLPTLAGMTITPSAEDQVIEKHRWLTGDITIKAASLDLPDLDNPAGAAQIREGYETISAAGAKITGSMPDAVVTVGQPGIDGNGVASIDISCSAGYITALQRTITQQLPTQGATTIEPGAEDQVIGAYKWLTGNITVKGILLDEQTVTPGENIIEVTPREGYVGLGKVIVEAVAGGGGGGSSDDVRYVTFKNYDGTDIGVKPVAVGDDCRYIFATPTRPSTAQYSYSHNGWTTTQGGTTPDSNALKAINEDKTLYATYTATVRSYTITYYDSDGTTVLKTETLTYGSMPSYTPTKENYNFDGWTPALTTVTKNASYTAQFSAKTNIVDGTFASGVTWALRTTGEFTVSGNGAMDENTSYNGMPWYSHKSKIKSVVIENGVTYVSQWAFRNCSALTSITIPASVTSIGKYAFGGATMTSLILPEGLIEIGEYAFSSCKALTSITIPASVTSIGKYVIDSSSNVTSFALTDPFNWYYGDSKGALSKAVEYMDSSDPGRMATGLKGGYANKWLTKKVS